MAKYYLNRKKTASGDVYDGYEAIADNPDSSMSQSGAYPRYPSARMTVHRTGPSTSTNWNFDKEPSEKPYKPSRYRR